MPRLVYSSEKHGQGATIELDSKEVVVCSIAQMGVLVYLHDTRSLLRNILSSIWGARLYNQRDVYKNAQTAQALSELYPDVAEPLREFKNLVLTVFANAIWHCGSAGEVCAVLNEAANKLPELERQASKGHIQRAFDAANSRSPKRTPEPPQPSSVAAVMSAYGALIEKYPVAILDVSMLPLPKKQMKVLLKGLYARATTAEMQNHIEVGFQLLSMFQEGVGPTPIDGRTTSKGTLPTKAELANLEKCMAWQDVSIAEGKDLLAEWQRFLAGEPI